MSDPKHYRTKDEWFKLIQECRRSGLSDAQWCTLNGISRHSLSTAIKRLRKCSYAIPSRSSDDIYDLTIPKPDVVRNIGTAYSELFVNFCFLLLT